MKGESVPKNSVPEGSAMGVSKLKTTGVDSGQRFQVLFIMGTDVAIIRDRNISDGHGGCAELEVPLDEPVTEENFASIFAELSESLFKSGKAGSVDEVLCTTFPAGSRIVRSGGAA
jgi:hypothetical protein